MNRSARVLRRASVIALLVVAVTTFFGLQAFALNPQPEPPAPIQVIIDSQTLTLDTPPIIIDGRALVPVRAIFEALGATVEWIPATDSIKATKGDLTVELQIGSSTAYVSGIPSELDVPAMLDNNRTLVPLSFVGQALGAEVDWNGQTRQVIITTAGGNSTTGTSGSTIPAAGLPKLFGSLVNVPGWIVSGLEQPSTSKNFDSAFIGRDLLIAKPIDPGLLQQILQNYVPSLEDFSQYTTFTEDQDGWGGCIGRSMMHVMNIQNEMECPYTPDLSFWYMNSRQDELANGGPVDSKNLLENYGICPEAYLPSDYDKATITNGTADYSTMPQPTAVNDQEAAFYKVVLLSDPITPDANAMKHLMMQYGPLLVEGNIPNVSDDHCMTVVGWDDHYNGLGAFKLLNSWGDHWGPNGDGTCWLTYSDLAANVNNLDIRYIQDGPSDRTGTKYAYSARINLQGGPSALRNGLTVSIAAVGQAPWVFWDQPNHLQDHCYDDSQNLCIDIPLPDYPVANWFPSANAQWSIQVTNHNSGPVTLQEFTVARQYKDANGKLAVETFSSGQKGAIIQGGGTASFTITNIAKRVIIPVPITRAPIIPVMPVPIITVPIIPPVPTYLY